ncbi:hypothetical protein PN836_009975 [Ningiella sp. W23]|uniref:hypothetical protein n=1 Tax=Ningiella sp. W23 TaxID=3023715 RepID=UPI003757C953
MIFQQGNPFEAIGAMTQYLRELQETQRLLIIDTQLKSAFWAYFNQQRIFELKESEINYDQPWWLLRNQNKEQ